MINKKIFLVIGILAVVIGLVGIVIGDTGGCCFDPTTGLCTENADSLACGELGGDYYSSSSCSVSVCNNGCCNLGTTTKYTTSRECQVLSNAYGIEYSWISMDRESCSGLAETQEKGACIYAGTYENECIFTTEGNCPTPDFHPGILCTAGYLNTTCEKTTSTTMIDNDDAIYFKDSCDNVANIYDASKINDEDYWAYVRSKSESCGFGESNAGNANCGNCNYNLSSIGRKATDTTGYPTYGDYICKDLDCGAKQNGESWCYIDSAEGFEGDYTGSIDSIMGEDDRIIGRVGSRFFRKYCLDGKIYTEPCSDMRAQFCSNGKCQNNFWTECFNAENDSEECNEMGDYCYMWQPENECVSVHDETEGTDTVMDCPGAGEPLEEALEEYGADDFTATAVKNPMVEDLYIEQCLPKIPGGINFWPSESGRSNSETSYCENYGTYEEDVKFIRRSDSWYGYLDSASRDYYHTIGLINTTYEHWKTDDDDQQLESIDEKEGVDWWEFDWGDEDCSQTNPYIGGCHEYESFSGNKYWTPGWVRDTYNGIRDFLPANPEVVELLDMRCVAISDCGVRKNWLGEQSGIVGIESSSNVPSSYDSSYVWLRFSGSRQGSKSWSSEHYGLNFPFDFECADFEAPEGVDCKQCGQDGLPCTQYRCKALGDNCEYYATGGVGYCRESNDFSPPKISHSISPESPIPPFTSVNITVITDETAECKFNIGSSGGTYDDMEYDLGEVYSLNHSVKLNLPGQIEIEAENITEYDLITEDGIYNVYVRCKDVAGNWNLDSHLITFEVDPTPDYLEPVISNFNPSSRSPIKYNTTTKDIKFDLDEPAQCRWSFEDKKYDEMEYDFECNEEVSDQGLLYGYGCSGLLTNISTDIDEDTRFYIRCKDQPWLEGREDETYYRNANSESKLYILKASEKLEIYEISPKGNIRLSAANSSLELGVVTIGGGKSGKAVCKWRLQEPGLNMTMFQEFSETNTSSHKQFLSNKTGGDYKIEVRCEDIAGNKANDSSEFNVLIDKNAPQVVRAYHSGASLIVITDEEAICKYTHQDDLDCRFLWDDSNITSMYGAATYHTADWKDDQTYYIRCKDYYDNENPGCAMVIRAY